MLKRFNVCLLALLTAMLSATSAFAAFTVPDLPVTNLETAGVAVVGLVAAFVLIKIVIRMIKGA